ncbi:MAG: TetR/AcrR family transcriptional regulator [Clostridia bacterium]|nr:TetR/AcrR family transcriptional regulator [Clostridia bacterium]
MIESIVERSRMLAPLSETEKTIIRSAIKLFLENGFTETTLKMISDDTGIRQGTLCYHFHTKEEMLYLLIQEVMDYHLEIIEEILGETEDKLFAYAMEISIQIALCEQYDKVNDIYRSAYNHQGTLDFIRAWGAKKNHDLLGDWLPEWSLSDFVVQENLAIGLENSSFIMKCNDEITLDDKVSKILEALMLVYRIPEDERNKTIKRVLATNLPDVAKKVYARFMQRIE